MKRWLWLGVSFSALSVPQLAAQEEPPLKPFFAEDGKPVMRAVPVTTPTPRPATPAPATPRPATPPPATPVPATPVPATPRPATPSPATPVPARATPAAVPVATPMPVAAPTPSVKPGKATPSATPSAKATPAPNATPAPLPKATPVPVIEVADPTTEIRLSPQGTMRADQVQLNIGDTFYNRKSYEQAAAEYEKYLTLYPTAPGRANVLYRLGESYRASGTVNAAKSTYESLITQFPESELLGPASYRLGDLYYAEKNYSAALQMFRRASVRLREAQLANSAKFFTARCLEALGQKVESRSIYDELTRVANDNPFLEASRLSLALLLKEAGRTADALKQAQVLAKSSTNEELKAQATVYSGLWELELEQPARAAENFKAALQLPGIARWRDVAEFGLMQIYFADKKYSELVGLYTSINYTVGAEIRPQMLTLVAGAYRQLGKGPEALVLLEQIGKEFPNTSYAQDALIERLTTLYAAGAANIVSELDEFLAANPESPKRDQVVLMKAEWLFKKQDYAGSAPLYAQLENSRTLSAPLKAEALTKLGWCWMQGKQYEKAVKAYSALIENYTSSKAIPSALCQRGLARERLKELSAALKDFDELITRFPKAKERELALHQKALIHGQLNNNKAMAESFGQLLKEYPSTPAAAEANYWLGWVAFEAKDYKAAAESLEKARKLDKEQYFERAGLRVLLSFFYLEDKRAVAREIEVYSSGSKHPVPYEVLHWLGQSYYESAPLAPKGEARVEAYRNAVKYLALVAVRDDARAEDFLNLGRANLTLGDFKKAADALNKYLEKVTDPIPRVIGLLALGQAQIGLKTLDAAQKSADAAFALQPEGEYNARARVLAGDIQNARGNFEQAAKVYAMVVVIDDENVTPQALEKAIAAYKACGKEADAKRLLNTLQSRYPEYLQKKAAER